LERTTDSIRQPKGSDGHSQLQQAEWILAELARVYSPASEEARTPAELDSFSTFQARYTALLEQIPAVVFMVPLDGGMSEAYVSPHIESTLGYTPEEWLHDPVLWYRTLHPEDRERWSSEAIQLFLSGEPLQSLYRVIARNGQSMWFKCDIKLVRRPDGQPWFFQGVGFDVTELKRTEELLKQTHQQLLRDHEERKRTEEKFRMLLEAAPDAMVIMNDQGRIVMVNSQTEKLFHYTREEILGQSVEMLIPQREGIHGIQHQIGYSSDPRIQDTGAGLQRYGLRKEGTEFPVEISLSPLETEEGTLLSSAIRDITEHKRAEQRILDSLHEKDVLLKEIHHRVKNNLAVISSLFYLQSMDLDDQRVIRAFQESQDRVRSMALVHEKLYRSENLAAVDFGEYAATLSTQLLRTYATSPDRVQLTSDLESVKMPLDFAVPCGLILNEMITNALKHAFIDNRRGEIRLLVRKHAEDTCILSVADNGVGIPVDLDVESSTSMGLRLIRLLTNQIDGQFEFVRHNPGTEARLLIRGIV